VGRVSDLVAEVLAEGEFDATDAQALRALTRRHRKMVVRARCFRKTVSVGPTVALQRDYALPTDLFEIFEVTVDGVTYGNARHVDLSTEAQGTLWLAGPGGVSTEEEDTAGVGTLALIPTPGDGGSVVNVRGAFSPPDLSVSDDTTLKITPDFDDALAAGAIGSLMRRGTGDFRADIAQSFEQEWSDACEELRRQTNRRYRGPGPTMIRVLGYNA
jgi:hypothetical protein